MCWSSGRRPDGVRAASGRLAKNKKFFEVITLRKRTWKNLLSCNMLHSRWSCNVSDSIFRKNSWIVLNRIWNFQKSSSVRLTVGRRPDAARTPNTFVQFIYTGKQLICPSLSMLNHKSLDNPTLITKCWKYHPRGSITPVSRHFPLVFKFLLM